ncbi:MAG TPA: DUF3078 domain-containing protein [Candidatus Acidoferrum sp.]|nr:DUF3078 domain-containing protein [Candidatus Acidoferrum sp.]
MRKIIITFALLCAQAAAATAADTTAVVGWKKSLIVDLTTTQTAYSDSWQGGEAGSLNWVSNLNGAAEKQLRPWVDFRSTLKLSFGQTMSQDDSTKQWSKPRKSTDLIDWENVGRFTVDKFVDPYLAFRLESQFMDVLSSTQSAYLSPMTLTESAGLARKFHDLGKDDFLTSRLGFAIRQTFKKALVADAKVDSTYNDGGIESVTDISSTLRKNLRYIGKLSMFKALYFSEKNKVTGTPFADDWKAVHINLENQVIANVTKILAVTMYTQFLYDKPISHKGRLKETLAFGLTFKLA